jgi:hypothetical protein
MRLSGSESPPSLRIVRAGEALPKLLADVDVFGELVGVGDISAGLDDVGEARPSHLQAGLDFLGDLLQLRQPAFRICRQSNANTNSEEPPSRFSSSGAALSRPMFHGTPPPTWIAMYCLPPTE